MKRALVALRVYWIHPRQVTSNYSTKFEFLILFFIAGIPSNNSFIILPTFADYYQTKREFLKLTPSPIFLNTAIPILKIVNKLQLIIQTICNTHESNTTSLLHCLNHHNQYQYWQQLQPQKLTNNEILELLQIQQLYDKFIFEIYEINEDLQDSIITMSKIGAYHIFNQTYFYDQTKVVDVGERVFCKKEHIQCLTYCRNFNRFREGMGIGVEEKQEKNEYTILFRWRSEAWVAALVSISAIGFFTCLAVLVFISIRVCKGMLNFIIFYFQPDHV